MIGSYELGKHLNIPKTNYFNNMYNLYSNEDINNFYGFYEIQEKYKKIITDNAIIVASETEDGKENLPITDQGKKKIGYKDFAVWAV